MIDGQLRPCGVLDDAVLKAFRSVPREAFVPEAYQQMAYADLSIPLADQRMMWSPLDCGRILQGLHLSLQDSVLLIGGESGYLAALLHHLVAEVLVVEPDEAWVSHLRRLFQNLGVACQCVVGDAAIGWDGSYDVIIVTGVMPVVPEALHRMLRSDGRLFVITGPAPAREATVFYHGRQRVLFETNGPLLPGVMEDHFVF